MLSRESILNELSTIEEVGNLRVLLAVESGSRCWGFASPDSDYDVRFVYARPLQDYLRLGKHRDTIEWRLDDVYDVAGWDISKYLRLLRSSNPSAFEWLGSTIIYTEAPEFCAVRELASECYNSAAGVHHYLGMAKNNWHAMEGEHVKLKKYLYVVRALLAARWATSRWTPPAMRFAELCEAYLEPEMKPTIDAVLAEKARGDETALHVRIPELDEWVERTMASVEEQASHVKPVAKLSWEPFDDVFRTIVAPQMP